jgi:Mrp family chromosome partitioning ATPase
MALKKLLHWISKRWCWKKLNDSSIAIKFIKNNKVGILDADIYGPNQHLLFNINDKAKI